MKSVMYVLKSSMLYFILVLAAGFVLGTIRTLWVVPQVGTRMAELMETPIMLVAIGLAAQWVVRRLHLPYRVSIRLGMGCCALILLLATEFTLVLGLRGMSINEYFATLDPVSGTVYHISLGIFAVMPLLVDRK